MSMMKRDFVKAGITAAVAGTVSILMGDGLGSAVSVYGFNLPVPALIAGTAAASSLSADLAQENILSHIPITRRLSSLEAAGLAAGVGGLSSVGILSFFF